MTIRLRSTQGVDALIASACAEHERELLASVFSPLFPDLCPWASLADVPELVVQRAAPKLTAVAQTLVCFRDGLTQTAGRLSKYLDASEEDIRELALRYAKYHLPGLQKLGWAERMLGTAVKGNTASSRFARVNDARFWRRAIRTRLLREREHFFLRLRLISRSSESYVSDVQLATRLAQLRRQVTWMSDTVLLPRYIVPGEDRNNVLSLAQVATSPIQRFAKLYTFTRAMDQIAQESGLADSMLTLTLEPEWHPNPSHGSNSWNGASPREAHRSMAARWQSILRDLDRAGIGLSGLRVVEPHKDACPHWHVWLIYRPENETAILATVMRYFPNKLKVRAPSKRGEKNTAADQMFVSRDDLLASAGRALTHENEGAQVELSRIDRTISSGASYVMKYLLETVDAGEKLNKEVGLFSDAGNAPDNVERRKKHQATVRRVDSYRSLWGINAGQLFGVAKCLTAWDELRRLATAPVDEELKRLWVLARGSDKEGRIPAGAEQRGDARGFILALGGLAACGKPAKGETRRSIGRLTESGVNGYGEAIERTKGVTLVERRRVQVEKPGRINKATGEYKLRKVWHSVREVVAQVRTRLIEWILTPRRMLVEAFAMAEGRFAAMMAADPAS